MHYSSLYHKHLHALFFFISHHMNLLEKWQFKQLLFSFELMFCCIFVPFLLLSDLMFCFVIMYICSVS